MFGNIIALLAISAFFGVEAYKVKDRIPRLIFTALAIVFALSGLSLPWTSEKAPKFVHFLSEMSGNPLTWLILATALFFVVRPFWSRSAPVANEASVGAGMAQGYDDREIRAELSRLTAEIGSVTENSDAAAMRMVEVAKYELSGQLTDIRQTLSVIAQYLISQTQAEFLDRAKPLIINPPMNRLSDGTSHRSQQAEFEQTAQYNSLKETLAALGFDLSKVERAITKGMDRLRADKNYLSIGTDEAGSWESLSHKQQWLERKLCTDAMNEFLEKAKSQIRHPALSPNDIAQIRKTG